MFAWRGNCHRQEVEGKEERTKEEPLPPGDLLELGIHCQSSQDHSHGEEGQPNYQSSPDLVVLNDEVDLTQFTVGGRHIRQTRRYTLTFSSCGGLRPLAKALFFGSLGKKRSFHAVFAFFRPLLLFSSNIIDIIFNRPGVAGAVL